MQYLFDQVIHDVPVVTGEPSDEPGHVLSARHRQGGKLKCGDPALGAPLEGKHVLCGEPQAHHVVEVGRGLVAGEAQVRGAHLD